MNCLLVCFSISRVYWSTVNARQRCVYTCRIIEIALGPSNLKDTTINHTAIDQMLAVPSKSDGAVRQLCEMKPSFADLQTPSFSRRDNSFSPDPGSNMVAARKNVFLERILQTDGSSIIADSDTEDDEPAKDEKQCDVQRDCSVGNSNTGIPSGNVEKEDVKTKKADSSDPFKCKKCKRVYRTETSCFNHQLTCNFELSSSDEEEEEDDDDDSDWRPMDVFIKEKLLPIESEVSNVVDGGHPPLVPQQELINSSLLPGDDSSIVVSAIVVSKPGIESSSIDCGDYRNTESSATSICYGSEQSTSWGPSSEGVPYVTTQYAPTIVESMQRFECMNAMEWGNNLLCQAAVCNPVDCLVSNSLMASNVSVNSIGNGDSDLNGMPGSSNRLNPVLDTSHLVSSNQSSPARGHVMYCTQPSPALGISHMAPTNLYSLDTTNHVISSNQFNPVQMVSHVISSNQFNPVQEVSHVSSNQFDPVQAGSHVVSLNQFNPVPEFSDVVSSNQFNPVHEFSDVVSSNQFNPVHEFSHVDSSNQFNPVQEISHVVSSDQFNPVQAVSHVVSSNQFNPVQEVSHVISSDQFNPVQAVSNVSSNQCNPVQAVSHVSSNQFNPVQNISCDIRSSQSTETSGSQMEFIFYNNKLQDISSPRSHQNSTSVFSQANNSTAGVLKLFQDSIITNVPPNSAYSSSFETANQQPTCVPAHQQPTSVPANQQPIFVPASEHPTLMPANQQQTLVPANRQPASIPANQQPIFVPACQQPTSTIANQLQSFVPVNLQPTFVSASQQPNLLPANPQPALLENAKNTYCDVSQETPGNSWVPDVCLVSQDVSQSSSQVKCDSRVNKASSRTSIEPTRNPKRKTNAKVTHQTSVSSSSKICDIRPKAVRATPRISQSPKLLTNNRSAAVVPTAVLSSANAQLNTSSNLQSMLVLPNVQALYRGSLPDTNISAAGNFPFLGASVSYVGSIRIDNNNFRHPLPKNQLISAIQPLFQGACVDPPPTSSDLRLKNSVGRSVPMSRSLSTGSSPAVISSQLGDSPSLGSNSRITKADREFVQNNAGSQSSDFARLSHRLQGNSATSVQPGNQPMRPLQPGNHNSSQSLRTLQPGNLSSSQSLQTLQTGNPSSSQSLRTLQPGNPSSSQSLRTLQPGNPSSSQSSVTLQPGNPNSLQSLQSGNPSSLQCNQSPLSEIRTGTLLGSILSDPLNMKRMPYNEQIKHHSLTNHQSSQTGSLSSSQSIETCSPSGCQRFDSEPAKQTGSLFGNLMMQTANHLLNQVSHGNQSPQNNSRLDSLRKQTGILYGSQQQTISTNQTIPSDFMHGNVVLHKSSSANQLTKTNSSLPVQNISAGSLLANLMMLAGSPNAHQQKNVIGSSSSHTGSPLSSLTTIAGSESHTSNRPTTAGAMTGGQNAQTGSLLGSIMLQTGSLAENRSMKTGSMSGCTIQTLLDNMKMQTVRCDDQQSKKTVPVCAQSVQTGSLLENLVWQNVSSLGNQPVMNYSVYEDHTVQSGSVQDGVLRPSASPSANKITNDSVSDDRNFQTGFLLGNLTIKNDSQFGSQVTKTAIVSGNQIIAIRDVLGGQIQTNSTFNNQFIQAGVLPFNIIQNNTVGNNVILTSASLPCDELMQNVGRATSHVHLMPNWFTSSK